MPGTTAQERKSRESTRLAKLSRMLQNTLRKWPNTSLISTVGAFGVRLEDGRYLHIVSSGQWTDADIRDLLVLFATWLAVDPDRLRGGATPLDGVSYRGIVE